MSKSKAGKIVAPPKSSVDSERRVLLVAALPPKADAAEEGEELSELAGAAGYFAAAMHSARIVKPKPATYLGGGAVEAAGELAEKFNANRVIVGADISSAQARNLEQAWKRPVLDRSDLILEIFAARARTYESKLQVELAWCKRTLARLAGRWTHLERQRGGIGVRGGPGEKQMEIDRRLLSDRIKKIERSIDSLLARNERAQARRAKNGALTAVLAGYTNAGKSTLFNLLTREQAPANDRVFDTLESTARRLFVGGAPAVLVDTVGFIRNLPHELTAGFRATLKEAAEGDLILVVADSARPDCAEQLAVVQSTLDSIGAARERRLLVMNKIDKTGRPPRVLRDSCGKIKAVWLSGLQGGGASGLRRAILEAATEKNQQRQSDETILPATSRH